MKGRERGCLYDLTVLLLRMLLLSFSLASSDFLSSLLLSYLRFFCLFVFSLPVLVTYFQQLVLFSFSFSFLLHYTFFVTWLRFTLGFLSYWCSSFSFSLYDGRLPYSFEVVVPISAKQLTTYTYCGILFIFTFIWRVVKNYTFAVEYFFYMLNLMVSWTNKKLVLEILNAKSDF